MQKEMFHVSLVALPDVLTGSLLGSLDLFSSVGKDWSGMTGKIEPTTALFTAEIVSTSRDPIACFAEISIFPHQSIFDLQHTDIVYLPSIAEMPKEPLDLQYQEMFAWIWKMYQQGATICAACSGTMMMAETGLLDDREATIHTAYIETFRSRYPKVILCPNRVIVQSGAAQTLITVGGDCTWQDLVLYLINCYAGTAAAIQTASVFLIRSHLDLQIPAFASFLVNFQHHDAKVRAAQRWLTHNAHQPHAVVAACQISGLESRTFNRRFKQATGFTPIAYIQNLRIERAKVQLETNDRTIDEIGVAVGYEDSSSFRILFKRITGQTPSSYRRKFNTQHKQPNS
jgi:transcriptional regulator GlxA family with amidase domain